MAGILHVFCFFLGLAWVATQLMALIQGIGMRNAACSRDLSLYLIITAVLPLFIAFASVFLAILDYLDCPTISEPNARQTITKTPALYAIQQQPPHQLPPLPRAYAQRAHRLAQPPASSLPRSGQPITPYCDVAVLSVLSSPDPAAANTTTPPFLQALPHFATQRGARVGSHAAWTPPRSTCVEMFNTTGPLALFVRLPIDDEGNENNSNNNKNNNTNNNIIPGQPLTTQFNNQQCADTITGRELAERYRAIDKKYAYNSIYSAIPAFYLTKSFIAKVCLSVLCVLVVLAFLAMGGWLIWGTFAVSKTGLDQCDGELYRSALATVIINWVAPFVAGIAEGVVYLLK